MKRRWLLCAAAIAFALPAHADAPVLRDLQPIIDSGKLVIALSSGDTDPAVRTDAAGGLGGFDLDLARALARRLGVEPEFHRQARSPDKLVDAVARGEADIGMTLLSITAERPSTSFSRARIRSRRSPRASIASARSASVAAARPTCTCSRGSGTVRHPAPECDGGWFREGVPDARLQEFDQLDELFDAALAGKVVLTVQGEIGARRLLYANPAAAIQLQLCVLDTRPDPIAIAVRPDAPGLARWIDAFLLERGVFYDAEVMDRYRGPWTFRKGDPRRR